MLSGKMEVNELNIGMHKDGLLTFSWSTLMQLPVLEMRYYST